MRASGNPRQVPTFAVLVCLLGCCFAVQESASAQGARGTIIAQLQQRFGLEEAQVRGALGALLVYARDRLPKPDFDQLAARIPDAEHIMQQVKARGIVAGPLDNIDDYEDSLSSLGIAKPVAAQFPAAVLESLGAAGYTRERNILARVLD